jgi:hypothetical protein
MFEVGQKVTVITDKAIAYEGFILARASGDEGQTAYKVALTGGGLGQTGQWHKAGDVFVQEPTEEEVDDTLHGLSEP